MDRWMNRRRQWHPTPVLLPGKSHGRRSLVRCNPWGCEESDMSEQFHFHFSLWCIGEGNGNPLQCSCLENPKDGRAWWAAICGVAQSRTRLKRLSSSSSRWMNKDVRYMYTYEYYAAIKKEWNLVVCDNMNGFYAKWNKSDRKKVLHDLTYMRNIKNKIKIIGTNRWLPETREIVYKRFKLSVIK